MRTHQPGRGRDGTSDPEDRRWIVKKTTSKKLTLKRQTLRALSGTELGEVAGGTTIVVVFSGPTIATTATTSLASITCLCARNTNDLAGR
jgi:hypothetical protein